MDHPQLMLTVNNFKSTVFIFTDIASNLVRDVPGSSFFLFGTADVPNKRDLVERRKQVGWFLGQHEMDYGCLKHDLGSSPSAKYGLTGKPDESYF